MAQKIVNIPGVGDVVLAKRRGSRHLRLSVTARGTVRVGMPYWVPYSTGIAFAVKRADWIVEQLKKNSLTEIRDGMRIGKSHRLYFKTSASPSRITTRITANEILVVTALPPQALAVQTKARVVAEKALKKEAEHLLPQRLSYLANKHSFTYKEVRVRKLTSRWGSCSTQKIITLSFYLMQLPWNLIDYVLVHELLHTRHMHHGPAFWAEFEKVIPNARKLRKEVNSHKPAVTPHEDLKPAR